MAVIKLTDIGIRSLAEGVYFDEKTPAFGIRVGKNRKTWIVLKEPNRTKVRIGHYPQTPLSEARRLALVALGTPLVPSRAPAFPAARTEYLAQGKWRERSRYQITNTLTRHFDWKKPIDHITHRDVAEAIDRIKAPSQAAHAFKDIRSFFNWCVPRYLKSSPCHGLKTPHPYVPRERVLSDDEIRKVWRAAEGMGSYGVLVQALLATGMRVGELQKFRDHWWRGRNIIEIPAAAAKNNRTCRLPVSDTASDLLQKIAPGQLTQGKMKKKLDKNSSITGWTLHDLRRTYATNMQRLGVRLEVTERLLNHVSGTQSGIVSVYQRHDFLPEMQEAVGQYEVFLKNLIGIATP